MMSNWIAQALCGDQTMGTTRSLPRWALLALALLAFVGLAGPGRADDDDAALRKKALKLNEVTGDEPTKGQILALLKDKEGTKKLLAVATKMAKEKEQPFNVNATYILARAAQFLKDLDTAETFYRLQVEQAEKTQSPQKLSNAAIGLIQVLCQRKQFAESEKIAQKFLELDIDDDNVDQLKFAVLRSLIVSLSRNGETDKATEKLDKLIKVQPDNLLNLELKADLLREAGKLEESAKAYEDLIERVNKEERLKKEVKEEYVTELRYTLSGVYVDLKQIDKAADHLKALLAKDPDNATFNNDLGYIWADHDMNLPEAEKMIRKAIEEDVKAQRKAKPDAKPEEIKANPAYLDSLGWVLFKQKKYKEAKPYLLDAVKEESGQHVEILDHLGDVHLALGEKEEAIAAWKKGVEAAGTSKREQARKAEVEKKLKANQ
jgi:tetratricopeptide (TPR) repeat protein